MINSKRKGKVNELAAAKMLSVVLGVPLVRAAQYKGGAHSADLVRADGSKTGNLHFEVKSGNTPKLREAMQQALRDAGYRCTPVIIHKLDHGDWLATLRADDLVNLVLDINDLVGDILLKRRTQPYRKTHDSVAVGDAGVPKL